MSRLLDLADIQGGILRDYGHHYPKGRYVFIQLRQATDDQGLEPVREAHRLTRAFLQELREKVTSALRWESKAKSYQGPVQADRPNVTTNVAFTFHGLRALGLPIRTLQRLPDEFINGMAARASVLGDVGANARSNWDDAWRPGAPDVHVLVLMRAGCKRTEAPCRSSIGRRSGFWTFARDARRSLSRVTAARGTRTRPCS